MSDPKVEDQESAFLAFSVKDRVFLEGDDTHGTVTGLDPQRLEVLVQWDFSGETRHDPRLLKPVRILTLPHRSLQTQTQKKLTEPPFKVGDHVMSRWSEFGSGEHWPTVVLSVEYRGGYCETGWMVVGASSDPCGECQVPRHPQTPSLDSAWFYPAEDKRPKTPEALLKTLDDAALAEVKVPSKAEIHASLDLAIPTETDHREALVKNLNRIGLPVYAKAVQKLPVIASCGQCGHTESAPWKNTYYCEHPDTPFVSYEAQEVRLRDVPPAWCPFRGKTS